VDDGRHALVYPVVEDVKEEGGTSRSSVKIDGSKRVRTMLGCGFAARVGDPRIRSETRIPVYAERVRREYAEAVVGGERERGAAVS
jgi:hypothetical protein